MKKFLCLAHFLGATALIAQPFGGGNGPYPNGAFSSPVSSSSFTTPNGNGQNMPWVPAKTILIFDGDSLTANANFYGYWMTNVLGWTNFAFVTNCAVAGQGIRDITNKWATSISSLAPGPGTNALYFLWIGINDYTDYELATFGGVNPYIFCNQLSNYWKQVQSSNMTVVAFTVTPRITFNGESPASKTNLWLINSFIRKSGIPDYVVDAQALFPNNHDQFFYLSDFVHLNTNCHYVVGEQADQLLRGAKHNPISFYQPLFSTNVLDIDPYGNLQGSWNDGDYALKITSGAMGVQSLAYIASNGVAYKLQINNGGALPGLVPLTISPAFPVPGTNCVAWWLASDLTTNGTTPFILDRWTNNFTLWASDSISFPNRVPYRQPFTLNYFDAIGFNGNQFLTNVIFVESQPVEYVMVLAMTNNGARTPIDGTNGTTHQAWTLDPASEKINAGTSAFFGPTVTNKWMVYDLLFNGASSAIYTNGTLSKVLANANTQGQNGLTVGQNFANAASASFALAELVIYTNVLSSIARSNLTWYYTNKYTIAP